MWLCVEYVVDQCKEKSHWTRHPTVKVAVPLPKIRKRVRAEKPCRVPSPLTLDRTECVSTGGNEHSNGSVDLFQLSTEAQAMDPVRKQLDKLGVEVEHSSSVCPTDSISFMLDQVVTKTVTQLGTPLSVLAQTVKETVQCAKQEVAKLFTSTVDRQHY